MLNQQKPLHAFLDTKIQLIIFVFQNLLLGVNMKTKYNFCSQTLLAGLRPEGNSVI